ncbi:PLC-like phosphodiesterase [Xylaria arbuscula]|nr:PLC-like phosphodiesterase [Xylaria arbuscula]
MCFRIPKPRATAPVGSTPNRRHTLQVHGTEAIYTLRRALNFPLIFTAPTAIPMHDDGTPGGVRQFYTSATLHRCLRKLFYDLSRGQPTLDRKSLQNFLEIEQGESQDQVTEILTEETYKYGQFLEVWFTRFGVEIERSISYEDKDLTRPITNYFIDSSHNTYLTGHQWSGKATVDTYKRALHQGCRCVEIDVWNNDASAPSRDKSSAGSGKDTPRSERSQKFSRNTLHTAGAHVKRIIDTKVERARQLVHVPKVHKHGPRCSKFSLSGPSSGYGNQLPRGYPDLDTDSDEGSGVRETAGRQNTVLARDEPIVMHGYTLNQPIGFRDVCVAIREAAFKTTHLPIIVSLEVYALADQQERMVDIMKEEWGGYLIETPHEAPPNGTMPRLEELLDKILIKVKRATLNPESSIAAGSLSPRLGMENDAGSGPDDDRSIRRPTPKVPICQNLSNLAVYTHSEHFDTFEAPSAKVPSHIYSISESKILDLWESKRDELFTHNRHYFMRAYPKVTRIDSSNPDPSQFWRKGVQMVAMNWQKWDDGMMLNKAMFSGEHGWVLKPSGYRSHGDDYGQTGHLSHRAFDLIITVIAGQDIPRPKDMPDHKSHSFRPLVKCELHVEKPEKRSGSPGEGGSKLRPIEFEQETGSGRTDHPEFGTNRRELCFRGVPRVEESLSFVRFRVEHEKSRYLPLEDALAGWACVRLDRLTTGYRLIPLTRPDGIKTEGVLLVRVVKNYR